jgi:hypothetical protein
MILSVIYWWIFVHSSWYDFNSFKYWLDDVDLPLRSSISYSNSNRQSQGVVLRMDCPGRHDCPFSHPILDLGEYLVCAPMFLAVNKLLGLLELLLNITYCCLTEIWIQIDSFFIDWYVWSLCLQKWVHLMIHNNLVLLVVVVIHNWVLLNNVKKSYSALFIKF